MNKQIVSLLSITSAVLHSSALVGQYLTPHPYLPHLSFDSQSFLFYNRLNEALCVTCHNLSFCGLKFLEMSVMQEHMFSLKHSKQEPGETGCSFSYGTSLSYLWIKSDRDTLAYSGARLQVVLEKHAGRRQTFMAISVYFRAKNHWLHVVGGKGLFFQDVCGLFNGKLGTTVGHTPTCYQALEQRNAM